MPAALNSFDLRLLRGHDIPMGAAERRAVAHTVRTLLSDYYVHLPQKMASMAIDPLRELELLADDAALFNDNMQFLDRLDAAFLRLRDRHTVLRRPFPWSGMIAFLPVVLESCYEDGRRKLLVSRVTDEVPDDRFGPGVEVTHWNGTPVRRLIERLSWQTPGSNPFARIALAQRSLTLRPLAFAALPEEDWVMLTYLAANGEVRHVSLAWKVATPPQNASDGSTLLGGQVAEAETALSVGLDEGTETVNHGLKELFAHRRRSRVLRATAGRSGALLSEPVEGALSEVARAVLAGRVTASRLTLSSGERYGYLRIFSFSVPDVRAFCEAMAVLLRTMPEMGLLIDVRANPGGSIPAGEALLHLLTDRAVSPTRNMFRATQAVRSLAGGAKFFAPWRRSLDMVYETGQTFSQGFPLTKPEDYAGLEGAYRGPLVVLMDALSYSTTDYFVAGFQDNALGRILGTDPTTGAGGANVWSLRQLAGFARDADLPAIDSLPYGLDCRVAVRRAQRAGPNLGLPLEGLGATADAVHLPTRRDILGVNEDLIMRATDLLREDKRAVLSQSA